MSKETQKVKVVMLPSKNQGYSERIAIKLPDSSQETGYSVQEVYFVSDEKLKEGEWYFDSLALEGLRQATKTWCKLINTTGYSEVAKKIIASTDSSLGLPGIPQSFLQKYTECQGKIDEVLVETTYSRCKGKDPREFCKYHQMIKLVNNEVIVVNDEESHQRNNLRYGGGFTEEDIKRVALKNKELNKAANKWDYIHTNVYDNPIPEAYKAGWKAHEQQSANSSREGIENLRNIVKEMIKHSSSSKVGLPNDYEHGKHTACNMILEEINNLWPE